MHAPASSAPLSKAGRGSDSHWAGAASSCKTGAWIQQLALHRLIYMAFQSFASEQFWKLYRELPIEVQRLADKQYELFREDPFHPSLHLKQAGEIWTVRIGRSHRAIGYREGNVFRWGWIGSHEAYNKLLRRMR
jgi:hypothetical protein